MTTKIQLSPPKNKDGKMKIFLFTVLWAVAYSTNGILFQKYDILTHPAAWATFGSIYGMVLFCGLILVEVRAKAKGLVWRNRLMG